MRDTFLIIGMIGKFDEIINATNCPRQMDIKTIIRKIKSLKEEKYFNTTRAYNSYNRH